MAFSSYLPKLCWQSAAEAIIGCVKAGQIYQVAYSSWDFTIELLESEYISVRS